MNIEYKHNEHVDPLFVSTVKFCLSWDSNNSVTNPVAYFSLHKTLLPTISLLQWPCLVTFICVGLTSHCHIYISTFYIYISTYLGRLRGSAGGPLQGGQPLVPGGHYQLGHRVRRAEPTRRLHQVQREIFSRDVKIFFNECTGSASIS